MLASPVLSRLGQDYAQEAILLSADTLGLHVEAVLVQSTKPDTARSCAGRTSA